MIRIDINNKTQKEIETLHWSWFFYRFKEKYKNSALKEARNIKKILRLKHINEVRLIVIGDYSYLEYFKNTIKKIDDTNPNYEIIKNYFGYENFKKGNYQTSVKWDAYKFTKALQVDVCPYCNRQYIFTINKNKKICRPEIDHFFPQSLYPYLSGSLYNFIPSCHICNHGKRDFGEGILYPYKEGFGTKFPFRVKFGKEADKSNDLINIDNVQVFFDSKDCKIDQTKREICQKCLKIQKSIKTFHLGGIYNKHKIELKDLFDRYRNYCQPKRKDILRLFHEDELKDKLKNLDIKNEKIRDKQIDAILSLYAKKMKNMFLGLPLGAEGKEYPLRKFKKDIIEQLDLTWNSMNKEQE